MSPIPELSPHRTHAITQWVWRVLILFNVAIACLSIQKLYAFASAMSGAQLLVIDTNRTLSGKIDQLDKDLVQFSGSLDSFGKKVNAWNNLFVSYTEEGYSRQKKNEDLVAQAKRESDEMMRQLADFAQHIEGDIQDAKEASQKAETAAHASRSASEETRARSVVVQKKVLQRLPPIPKKKPTFLGIPLN